MIAAWVFGVFVVIGVTVGEAVASFADINVDPIIVCYISSWATYRPGAGKFDTSNVDPRLCSHLVYAFAGLNAADFTIKSLDPWNDLEENGGKGGFRKVTQLRNANPSLKVSLAIGGWNEGSANYSLMVSDEQSRRSFVGSAVKILRDYDFNGLDLDWEYPTKRGGKPEDRENFALLVKELRQAFDREQSAGRRWLLTSAIGAAPDVLTAAYDLRTLSQHLDFLHIMSYDYHGLWEPNAGVNAPLRGRSDKDQLSVEKTLESLLSSGVAAEKLVLGLPFYGRTFIANNPSQPLMLGSPTSGEGFPGPYTKEAGSMGYNEICAELVSENASHWKINWDERSSTPYAVREKYLISYDDPSSIQSKVLYGMKKGIAGMMVWALDTDDFSGACSKLTGHTNFPLLRTIRKAVIASLNERINEIEKDKSTKGSSSSIRISVPAFFHLMVLFAIVLKV